MSDKVCIKCEQAKVSFCSKECQDEYYSRLIVVCFGVIMKHEMGFMLNGITGRIIIASVSDQEKYYQLNKQTWQRQLQLTSSVL